MFFRCISSALLYELLYSNEGRSYYALPFMSNFDERCSVFSMHCLLLLCNGILLKSSCSVWFADTPISAVANQNVAAMRALVQREVAYHSRYPRVYFFVVKR